MALGFDCEYPTFTACMNANRDKADPGAWCGWLKKKTEKKCLSGLASMRLPADLSSPGAALSSRHEWELHAQELADQAVADFLVQVESAAREASTGTVVLAAGWRPPNPFSRALVRSIWRRLTGKHQVLEDLPEDELADLAYERTAEVLTSIAGRDTTTERLTTTLVYESDTTDWRARTTRAARTYATRMYNETVLARMMVEGHTRKRWVSRRDEATRHSHREADGQTVPIEDNFRVGSALLLHPGDETGPAGEVYNCRCVVVAG